jgi:uncharacterized Zn-binding protein involved in type VI secretion
VTVRPSRGKSQKWLAANNYPHGELNVRKAAQPGTEGEMRRALLKVGDKSSSGGVIIEGAENVRHHGTPVAFIGAKVWCNGCNSEGTIGWKGPHQTATMNGRQQALDGDICICKCDPPPVLFASQNSARHAFESYEQAGARYAGVNRNAGAYKGRFDECVMLYDAQTGSPLANISYRYLSGNRILASGVTDSQGRTLRIVTDDAQSVELYVKGI